VLNEVLSVWLRHDDVAIGCCADDPIRIRSGQRARDHCASMKAVNGCALYSKCIHEFDDRLGEVTRFCAIDAERIRQPESGSIWRDTSEVRFPPLHRGEHVS
jgi:hypothetical protein